MLNLGRERPHIERYLFSNTWVLENNFKRRELNVRGFEMKTQRKRTKRPDRRMVIACPARGKALSTYDGVPFCGMLDCNLYGLAQPDSYKPYEPAQSNKIL